MCYISARYDLLPVFSLRAHRAVYDLEILCEPPAFAHFSPVRATVTNAWNIDFLEQLDLKLYLTFYL